MCNFSLAGTRQSVLMDVNMEMLDLHILFDVFFCDVDQALVLLSPGCEIVCCSSHHRASGDTRSCWASICMASTSLSTGELSLCWGAGMVCYM